MLFLSPTHAFARLATVAPLLMSNHDHPFSSLPRIDSVTKVASTKWLELQTLSYTDQNGESRQWDVVSRTTKQSSDTADAVIIIPILRKSNSSTIETLLVEQYRPPVSRVVVSFPAGLIDEGESPQDAALRELREETGFVGDKSKVQPLISPQVCMSPGMSDSSAHCVVVEVNLDNPLNRGIPETDLDEGEFISVKRVDLKEGLKKALDNSETMPHMGLYLFAMGLELAQSESLS